MKTRNPARILLGALFLPFLMAPDSRTRSTLAADPLDPAMITQNKAIDPGKKMEDQSREQEREIVRNRLRSAGVGITSVQDVLEILEYMRNTVGIRPDERVMRVLPVDLDFWNSSQNDSMEAVESRYDITVNRRVVRIGLLHNRVEYSFEGTRADVKKALDDFIADRAEANRPFSSQAGAKELE